MAGSDVCALSYWTGQRRKFASVIRKNRDPGRLGIEPILGIEKPAPPPLKITKPLVLPSLSAHPSTFSSLMKQKKKGKFASSFTSPDFVLLKIFCYEVILKENFQELFSNYYSSVYTRVHRHVDTHKHTNTHTHTHMYMRTRTKHAHTRTCTHTHTHTCTHTHTHTHVMDKLYSLARSFSHTLSTSLSSSPSHTRTLSSRADSGEAGLLGRRVYNAKSLLEILDRFRDIFKL